jgi:hypothetical protein
MVIEVGELTGTVTDDCTVKLFPVSNLDMWREINDILTEPFRRGLSS